MKNGSILNYLKVQQFEVLPNEARITTLAETEEPSDSPTLMSKAERAKEQKLPNQGSQ